MATRSRDHCEPSSSGRAFRFRSGPRCSCDAPARRWSTPMPSATRGGITSSALMAWNGPTGPFPLGETFAGSRASWSRRRNAPSRPASSSGASSALSSRTPMPLRIAIVSQAYHPAVGGVTEHVSATSRLLAERGHEVTVVTGRFGGGETESPRVRRIGRNIVVPYNGAENNITVGWGLGKKLDAVLTDGRFDVIHVHCPLSPMLPLLALRSAKQPVVGTFHSTASNWPFRLFHRQLLPYYRRIDHAIAVSETARDFVTRSLPGPVEGSPNGVALDRVRPGLR